LIFSDDALVTVGLAFNAVLEHVPCLGGQANNFEQRPSCVFLFLTPIRRKPNRLANRKSVGCHRTLSAQCSMPPPCRGGAAPRSALLRSKCNGRRLALLAALHLVAEFLALVQIADPRPFDGRNVDEHVPRTIVGLDKAVSLLDVEPLYGSGSHCIAFQKS